MKKPNLSRLYEAGIREIGKVSAKQILAFMDENPHLRRPRIAEQKSPTNWDYDTVCRNEFIAIFEKIADQEPSRRFRVTPRFLGELWVELDKKTSKAIWRNVRRSVK